MEPNQPITSLSDSLRSHDSFFNLFINMIPKEIYRGGDDDDEEIVNPRYFKHRKEPLTLNEKKLLSRKRKMEKYSLADDDSVDENEEINENNVFSENMPAAKLPIVNIKNLALSKKKKDNRNLVSHSISNKLEEKNHVSEDSVPTLDSVEFNEIIDNGSKSHSALMPMKPGSKVKRLKRMLQEAEDKRNRLEAFQRQGSAGKELAKQEIWSDAIIDASGAKSLTDTGKLRKALKKIEKKKSTSSKEWKARIEAVEESKGARQEQRDQNIKARKEGKPVVSKTSTDSRGGNSNGKSKIDDTAITNPKKNYKSILPSKESSTSGSSGGNKNRPGFEGKKKSNAKFLNEKKS